MEGSSTPLSPSSVLSAALDGKYRILHTLGAGSGGQVYKALQVSTGQAVAVKVLDVEDLETSQASRRVERFRREIAICSKLYHPDIVRLLDSDELEESTHYAVFEYIPGTTLAELLREEGMLTVHRAKRLMSQLLAPLAYAHSNGIAHRDLKPSNVMVMSDGGSDRVKILDFGISVATEQRELTRLTLSHEWVGTPAYAAPEQLRGEPADAKADLYAWALMFLECLTGVPAIRGKWLADIIEQQLQPVPLALPEVLSKHRLGALLLRVLEKDPTRRPRDAQQLASMLERVAVDGLEDQRGFLRDSRSAGLEVSRLTDTVTDGKADVQIERRRATILCAKVSLVGSKRGADVEQLDQVLEDANALVGEVIEQYGARAPQALGGYSLAYFGLKQTRDSDARLAMRAALELANRFEKTPRVLSERGLSLRLQVGIHHGPVIVRVFRDTRQQIDGLTARVAIELASAQDGTGGRILVSEEFRQLVARYAEFAPAGREYSTEVPWSQQPLRGYSLAGESRSALIDTMASHFVGRESEIALLVEAWGERHRRGSALLLRGDPGIGKSRLSAELRQRLAQQGVGWIEARCLPEWQNAFLRPLATLFSQLFGLNAVSPAEAGELLKRQLSELGVQTNDTVPLFCVWLSLPLPEGSAPLTWSPQKQRQLLHQRVAETLIASMRRRAVLLIEDLHWADPSTIECIELLLRSIDKEACLLLLTSRPGPSHPWSVPPREIVLGRLDEGSARTLAAALLQHGGTSELSIAKIAERSDGIPLYLEELALTLRGFVAESYASTEGGRANNDLPTIPASLRDLLTSRLEGVGSARRIAEFAAAIGREFSFELLAALSVEDEFQLLGDIEQLVNAEVLVKQLRVDSSVYSFRHALIRDAAYDDMQPDVRASAHRRIASGLELRFPKLVEAEPDILAHHWERAQNHKAAVHYWHTAAQKSRAASAHQEALDQLDRGLALVRALPESAEIGVLEAELLLSRGATVLAKRGYTAPEVEEHFSRVLELLPGAADASEPAFAARWGLWYFHNTRGNLDRAEELATRLRASADAAGSTKMSVSAWEAICETRFYLGNLAGAVDASRRCENDYDFDHHRQLASLRGDDPHLASLSFEAIAEMARGRIDSGLARVEQALALAERLSYPTMKAAMHCQAARVFMIWGSAGAINVDVKRARWHSAEALRISREQGYQFWDAYARVIDAAAAIAEGDATGVELLREASDRWNSLGARLGRCWHLSFVSDALRQRRQLELAGAALDEALAFCESSRSRFFEPEVRRRRAELVLELGAGASDRQLGWDEFARASATAAACGAHFWGLSIAVSKLRNSTTDRSERLAELKQCLLRCEVGVDAPPPLVSEARALLTQS